MSLVDGTMTLASSKAGREHIFLRTARWISVPLMAAGLALTPGCKDKDSLCAANPGKDYVAETKTDTRVMRQGEFLFKAGFPMNRKDIGFWGYKVAKIDSKGIELSPHFEIYLSEHVSGEKTSHLWRVEYGDSRTFRNGAGIVTVTPKHCGSPETAIVTYTAILPRKCE
jgi:hypothetical protein